MAKISRNDLFTQDATDAGPVIVEALAPLATGLNKDGTAFVQSTVDQPDASGTANLTASGQSNTFTVPQGMTTCSFITSGTWAGTVAFEFADAAGNYNALNAVNAASNAVATSTTSNGVFEAAIPAGTVTLRMRCSAFTSGTIATRVATSFSSYEPAVSIAGGTVVVGQGSNPIGRVIPEGTWWIEAPTATLAPAAGWQGVTRDCWAVAQGSAPTVTTKGGRFRGHAVADQPFLLIIACSDDGVTWDPVVQVGTTSISGLNTAYGDAPVVSRYMRVQMYNSSATAFTLARARSVALAAG